VSRTLENGHDRDIPLAVRWRSNSDSALAHLSLPEWMLDKELRRIPPPGRHRGARTGLRDGAIRGAGAIGKAADLLSELLPVSGAPNAGTVRSRTMRIGEAVAQSTVTTTATPRPAEPVFVGLDGDYVRSRHRQDERHFEVIAGNVIGAQGS
jgi:hypothetical protein